MVENNSLLEPQAEVPDKNWNLLQLAAYVKDQLKCYDEMRDDLHRIGRFSSVALFRAGRALAIVFEHRKQHGGFENWLKEHKIAKTTAFEARKLYETATRKWGLAAEMTVEQSTITKVKTRLGVIKPKANGKTGSSKPTAEEQTDHSDEQPLRADQVLKGMSDKLHEVVNWEIGDLDKRSLDAMARKCIKMLQQFLITETLPIEAEAPKKGMAEDAA